MIHQSFCRVSFHAGIVGLLFSGLCSAEVKTWDGQHSIEEIEVTVVYFVPQDRPPLIDWNDRAAYFCRRIEQFHQREYGGQSKLNAVLHAEPFVSEQSTAQLREGDANAIFFKTLREVDRRLRFAQDDSQPFPILLVLSEVNWRPLDDFYRVKPGDNGLEFEGQLINQQHFPGATSGGARATYLARERKGWGLVSADGWRVPYRGTDCVVYHEGVGHTVGLPHPEPGNGSVMSFGQYRGWLNESWLDKDQKLHLGWNPEAEVEASSQLELFSEFTAVPEPLVPQPGESVSLRFTWPEGAMIQECRVRYQTGILQPWRESQESISQAATAPPERVVLGRFDRPTPVSYRVDVMLVDGQTAELWGYLQVREDPRQHPLPRLPLPDLVPDSQPPVSASVEFEEPVDLLSQIDPQQQWKQGDWTAEETGTLVSPKAYGARIELPGEIPEEYRLIVIAEPLDSPNGLLLGAKMGPNRFASLFNYVPQDIGLSALENVNGDNVGNPTTVEKTLFQQGQLSQIVLTVLSERVTAQVDGETILDWQGSPDELSLSDYWSTPDPNSLFLGTYDCSYRIHRISLMKVRPSTSTD